MNAYNDIKNRIEKKKRRTQSEFSQQSTGKQQQQSDAVAKGA